MLKAKREFDDLLSIFYAFDTHTYNVRGIIVVIYILTSHHLLMNKLDWLHDTRYSLLLTFR